MLPGSPSDNDATAELCHVGVGVPGTVQDILGNAREKTRERGRDRSSDRLS